MRIILLGAPGAGKGTQASYLTKFFGIPLIATGNILRAAVQAGTKLGLTVKALIDQGSLVPDNVMISLVKERLSEPDCVKGYLLDGFPRTIPQAEALHLADIHIDFVVEIHVPDEEIIKRLCGRRVHSGSGRIYHIHYNPPKISNQDDITAEPLTLREDDKQETVCKRLKVYHAQTEPLRNYYRNQFQNNPASGRYIRVDGAKPIEEVQQVIVSELRK